MKRYGFLYLKLRMLIVEIHILQIEFLCFEDTVLSLSDSIVRRIVPFGHTDLNMMFPQQVYICVASVLGATVRMMYRSAEIISSGRLYGHL